MLFKTVHKHNMLLYCLVGKQLKLFTNNIIFISMQNKESFLKIKDEKEQFLIYK